jgi:hypothetical protein
MSLPGRSPNYILCPPLAAVRSDIWQRFQMPAHREEGPPAAAMAKRIYSAAAGVPSQTRAAISSISPSIPNE